MGSHFHLSPKRLCYAQCAAALGSNAARYAKRLDLVVPASSLHSASASIQMAILGARSYGLNLSVFATKADEISLQVSAVAEDGQTPHTSVTAVTAGLLA